MSHTETYRRLLESIAMYSKKMLDIFEHGAGDLPQWSNDLISESRTHLADVTHFLRGQANHGIRYGAAHHGRAYMATANLRQIHEYANECLGDMKKGAGHFPAWVENKISVVAEYMDLIGHWLENEGAEGRKYGTHNNPVPGDAGDVALYRGRADGITGQHRTPYSPNSFQRKIYEQGFEEGFGRPAAPPANAGDGGMGRGRGRRRRHRRNGIQSMPFWNIPVHAKEQNGEARSYSSPGIKYQSGFGSMMAREVASTVPMDVSGMEYTMPPSRMVEPIRMTEQSRMLWHQTGRRFGVPGFRAGQPGWAGAGGVAQIPGPSRGMQAMPDRTFGPGLSAGQGGVQSFSGGGGGRGAMGVQTYGSLGYGSMGDGSMDMAVRGGRQYAAPPKSKRSKSRRKKGKKMTRPMGRLRKRGPKARASGLRVHVRMAPAPAALTERERINKIKDPHACAQAGYIWNPGWNICVPVEN